MVSGDSVSVADDLTLTAKAFSCDPTENQSCGDCCSGLSCRLSAHVQLVSAAAIIELPQSDQEETEMRRRDAWIGLLVTGLLLAGRAGHGADLLPWLEHTFDAGAGFRVATLCGQKGWTKFRACPTVRESEHSQGNLIPHWGQYVVVDPAPGSLIAVSRAVTPPTDRWQVLEFDTRVSADARSGALARVTVNTDRDSWGRKFQFYIGPGLRLNYGPTSAENVVIVAPEEMIRDRWYHVRLLIDLTTSVVDVWAGPYGLPGEDFGIARLLRKATSVPIHPGRITGLDLWGWDLPGSVHVDNLVGHALLARITNPDRESVVHGVVAVDVEATSTATSVELLVDGASIGATEGGNGTFLWDSGLNVLPCPVGPGSFGFGYFFPRHKGGDNHWSEVSGHTNLYHAWAGEQYGSTATPDRDWLPRMAADLAAASRDGKRIVLQLNLAPKRPGTVKDTLEDTPVEHVLALFNPSLETHGDWDSVDRIELCNDCDAWPRALFESLAAQVHTSCRSLGLMEKKLGAVFQASGTTSALLNSSAVDFVTYEAYLGATVDPAPYHFSPLPQRMVSKLRERLRRAVDAIDAAPGEKEIVVAMQAYTRSGAIPNADLVRDLQIPTFLEALQHQTVSAIEMFSYDRLWGTRQHRPFSVPHRLIGQAVLGSLPPDDPPVGNGRRTLVAQACNAAGRCTWDVVYLEVQN